jgi:hypothetical protein
MLEHTIPGCPANADCSIEMGDTRLNWLKFLKSMSGVKESSRAEVLEKYRRDKGIPLNYWILPQKEAQKKVIIWDSHCRQHNAEEKQKILLGVSFAKSFKELLDIKGALVKKVYLAKDKKVISYLVPRIDTPMNLKGDSLYYTLEEEGFYYGLLISPQNELTITELAYPEKAGIEVACPINLIEQFQMDKPLENLYSGHFCKSLWDTKLKLRQTLLFGWACN